MKSRVRLRGAPNGWRPEFMDPAVVDRALAIYSRMTELRCTCPPRAPSGFQRQCADCKAWYNLHSDLHRVLGALLWAWPCCADIRGQITNSYAAARERELAAALKGNGHDRDSDDEGLGRAAGD
jgi:hypothetical protein